MGVDLKVDHMQIDNMSSDENPIIFTPFKAMNKINTIKFEEYPKHRLLIKKDEEQDPNYKPFIDIGLSFYSSSLNHVVRKKVDNIKLIIEPMIIELETGILNIVITNVTEIAEVFQKKEVQYLTSQTVEDNQINIKNLHKKAVKVNLVEEAKTLKENLQTIPDDTRSSFNDQIFEKENICEELVSKIPEPPDLGDINTDKLFFKRIRIDRIRLYITFRFEKRALSFDLNKGFGALTILYTLLTSVANVSKVPLRFDTYLKTNMFASQNQLIDLIAKSYGRQAFFQFYKIFMSTDLLGNPLNLISNAGESVADFFKESHKGIRQGI